MKDLSFHDEIDYLLAINIAITSPSTQSVIDRLVNFLSSLLIHTDHGRQPSTTNRATVTSDLGISAMTICNEYI